MSLSTIAALFGSTETKTSSSPRTQELKCTEDLTDLTQPPISGPIPDQPIVDPQFEDDDSERPDGLMGCFLDAFRNLYEAAAIAPLPRIEVREALDHLEDLAHDLFGEDLFGAPGESDYPDGNPVQPRLPTIPEERRVTLHTRGQRPDRSPIGPVVPTLPSTPRLSMSPAVINLRQPLLPRSRSPLAIQSTTQALARM